MSGGVYSPDYAVCDVPFETHSLISKGRIKRKRDVSSKLYFFDLLQDGMKLQVVSNFKDIGSDIKKYKEKMLSLSVGDIVSKCATSNQSFVNYSLTQRTRPEWVYWQNTRRGTISLCNNQYRIARPMSPYPANEYSGYRETLPAQACRPYDPS